MQVDRGLAGVVVAETALSRVDGAAGSLWFRGHELAEIAGSWEVSDVAGLLSGRDPALVRARLGEGRVQSFARLVDQPLVWQQSQAMDALRAALGTAAEDEEPAAIIAVALALWCRHRGGGAPVAPDPSAAHAADLYRMMAGHADLGVADALRTYLVTVADHGLNASTFTARVVASTGSDTLSCVLAALGALKGPLHGGAPGPVLDMLDAIGRPERAEAWIRAELAEGRRIMGMGHRVYRTRDPRAAVLEQALSRLEAAGSGGDRLTLARGVEASATQVLGAHKPQRVLRANVEFYTAVLLERVGLDRRAFTAAFAAGRVVGWQAHVLEQRETGRLIRPSARYVGPTPAAA